MIQFSIIDAADQQFGTIINNQRVTFRLRWNDMAQAWAFDVSIDDLPVLTGKRIVLGADLLGSLSFNLGQLWALDYLVGAYPGREELPAGDVRLYHFSDEEFEAYQRVA